MDSSDLERGRCLLKCKWKRRSRRSRVTFPRHRHCFHHTVSLRSCLKTQKNNREWCTENSKVLLLNPRSPLPRHPHLSHSTSFSNLTIVSLVLYPSRTFSTCTFHIILLGDFMLSYMKAIPKQFLSQKRKCFGELRNQVSQLTQQLPQSTPSLFRRNLWGTLPAALNCQTEHYFLFYISKVHQYLHAEELHWAS